MTQAAPLRRPAPPRASVLKAFAADPERFVGLLGGAGDDPAAGIPPVVTGFLEGLAVFTPVPFNYLVADPRMLPAESMRFFYVDPNWVRALLDGACSIGRTTTLDQAQDQGIVSYLQQLVSEGQGTDGPFQSGLLIRSRLVADYPGLQIRARDASGQPLGNVRVATLSSEVLVALFTGLAASIDLTQPPQGLQFGVSVDPQGGWQIDLRGLGKQNDDLGVKLAGTYPGPSRDLRTVADNWRQADKRVLDVAQLAANLVTALGPAEWPPPPAQGQAPLTQMTSAELAVELVDAPQTATVTITWKPETALLAQTPKRRTRDRASAARAGLDAFLEGL